MRELIPEDLPLSGIHLIEASAGTGKTYNITRLYLRLLLERELSVQQILVMTFTRAATAELKGRLAAEIERAHEDWETLDEPFYRALRERVPDAARARALLRSARLHMDEAAVYTIHGFCRRALTQGAFHSGISFHAEMEADASALVLEALADWYRQTARSDAFGQLYDYCPTPQAFQGRWQATILSNDPLPEPEVADPAAAWADFREAWPAGEREAFRRYNVDSRKKPRTRRQWEGILEQLDALAEQECPGRVPDLLGPKGALRKDGLGTAKKQAAMPALHALATVMAERSAGLHAWWAWRGITYAREHVRGSKDRLDLLDFADLIRVLRERVTVSGGDNALARQLAAQFPAALVDEFQDTDPDQYAILRAVYGDAGAQGRLLGMIGDPKQAIYGFRGGDVFAYLDARDDADAQWVMGHNFRSAEGVIHGYNRLFYGGPLPEPLSAAEPGTELFGYGIAYHPVAAGGAERPAVDGPADRAAFQWGLLPVADGQPGLNSKGTAYTQQAQGYLARWCAAEIRRLLAEDTIEGQALTPGDVAILVRDRYEAATVQRALGEAGLASVYLSARDNVLATPEAAELYRALHGILHLEDDRALLAALATPLFGLGADDLHALQGAEREWARILEEVTALRERWVREGFLSMALRLLQRRLRPEPERHERALTNYLHLLELLQEASQSRRQPEALLHWFRQAGREGAGDTELRLESDAQLVRVQTLHGAKGLEYPVVFLPFVSYGKADKTDQALLVRYHDPQDRSPRLAFNPDAAQREQAREERAAEDLRLLYVGATRGERRVYMLAAAFASLAQSPLARCLGAGSFEEVARSVHAQAEEGACGVIDLTTAAWPEAEPPAEAPPPEPLEPAVFRGRIERDWQLASFSALTRNLRHGGTSARDRDAEGAGEEATLATAGAGDLRFRLPRGAEAGNLLHDILERLDFAAEDPAEAVRWAGRRYPELLAPQNGAEAGAEARERELAHWLGAILQTPLPSGAQLADLPARETLRETGFVFPVDAVGSDRLAGVLARHRGAEAVALPAPARLRGMLQGYIDLIYRWRGRYYVVDYKSNYLGDRLDDYAEPALTRNVQESLYDLQYLLYTLALHRYLRTRLEGYDPAAHLGGVHYLYLRGLHPERATGIHDPGIDLEALSALDRLFEGEGAAA